MKTVDIIIFCVRIKSIELSVFCRPLVYSVLDSQLLTLLVLLYSTRYLYK